MSSTKKVIIIVGPTAIGKTALSINIAKRLNTEIISCDSRQFYKELLIGAAPPSQKELTQVKHHFIHNLSVDNDYNAGTFELDAMAKIEQLHKTKDTIIIVGGSGLYFKALTEGLVKIPDIPNNVRTQTRKLHKKIGQKNFFIQLIKLDPLVKRFVLPSDTQRSMRAYEVKKFTKKSLFEFTKETKSNFNNIVNTVFSNTFKRCLR